MYGRALRAAPTIGRRPIPWLAQGSSSGVLSSASITEAGSASEAVNASIGDAPSLNSPLPSGSLSFTPIWLADANADSYVVFVSTATTLYADPALFSYWYLVSGQATQSLLISNVASGTKYVRVAAVENGYLGPLGEEVPYTPA